MEQTQITPQPNDSGRAVAVSTTGLNDLPMELISKMMADSKKLEAMKPKVELSSTYIELEKVGDTFKGIYAGNTTISVTNEETGEQRELTAARFIVDGKVRLNAGYVLISELKQTGVPVGTPLQVKYERKDGKTKIYSLSLLG